jgi:molybdopterin-containing oxidoreductase family iron-sulfur binding subunit
MVRKRPDGIVEFAQDQLRGAYARAAASACPFKAVHVDDGRTFTGDTPVPQDYEHRAFVENGKTYTRRPGVNALEGAARKCTFCSHRLDIRLLPACVATCVGGAMYFGDGNNPANLVNEITGGRLVFNGHQNQGVGPRVLYFEESLPGTLHIPCGSCHL